MLNPYGILISTSALLGLLLTRARAKYYSVSLDHVENLFILLALTATIGGRLYHVSDRWPYYATNPLEIFYIWQGGLGIYGALLAGIISVLVYSAVKKLDHLTLFDLIAPSIPLAQAIGRIGNFFNAEGYGPKVQTSWKNIIQFSYHPTFFYEASLCFLLFLFLQKLTKPLKPKPGALFGVYLLGYGLIRLFTETLRSDTAVFAGVKTAIIFSLIFILSGFYLIRRLKLRKLKSLFTKVPS